MYNFLSDDNRLNRLDEFIAAYHEQLTKSLKKFGYLKASPSLLDLQMEMLINGNVRTVMAVCVFPYLIYDFATLTAEDFAEGQKALQLKIFKNQRFKNVIEKELKIFINKGFL